MDETQVRAEIEALGALLDTYGADRTRWPASARLRFAPLIAGNGEARRLLARAEVFDRLLDLAPRAAPERERALVERVVTAALGARTRGDRPSRTVARFARPPGPAWQAAALLAASLLLGVFVGAAMTDRYDGEPETSLAVFDDGAGGPADDELL